MGSTIVTYLFQTNDIDKGTGLLAFSIWQALIHTFNTQFLSILQSRCYYFPIRNTNTQKPDFSLPPTDRLTLDALDPNRKYFSTSA